MFSYFEPNFIEKFLWESGLQILAKIEMTQNKNRIFGGHFETVQQFQIFCRIVTFYSPYIYGAISLQNSGGKVVFLKGASPLDTNRHDRSKSTLVT